MLLILGAMILVGVLAILGGHRIGDEGKKTLGSVVVTLGCCTMALGLSGFLYFLCFHVVWSALGLP